MRGVETIPPVERETCDDGAPGTFEARAQRRHGCRKPRHGKHRKVTLGVKDDHAGVVCAASALDPHVLGRRPGNNMGVRHDALRRYDPTAALLLPVAR